VIESLDGDEIKLALVGYQTDFVESFLSLLPTKKALMIQNDLYHMTDYPPVSQCAEGRRKICNRIEQEFELQRFSVAEHWKQFDFSSDSVSQVSQPFNDHNEVIHQFSDDIVDEVTSVDMRVEMKAEIRANPQLKPMIDTFPPAVFDDHKDDNGDGEDSIKR
jgi:hypothetical protein